MAELAAGAEFKGSSPWGDPVHDAHNLGGMLLVATSDCARALVQVLSPGVSPVYAHVVLARSSLELSSRAWWLFEPAIALRLCVARGMNERIFGLSQQTRLRLAEKDVARASERLNELFAEAARLDFKTVPDRRRHVRYLEEMPPSQTELIKKLLSTDGDASLGAPRVWSVLGRSSWNDVRPNVQCESRRTEPPENTWRHMGSRVYESSLDVVSVLTAVILGTAKAHRHRNEFFGWASQSWNETAARAIQAAKSSLPPAKTT